MKHGFGVAYLFLRANKVPILFDDESFENLVVAKGNRKKEAVAFFFEHGFELAEENKK